MSRQHVVVLLVGLAMLCGVLPAATAGDGEGEIVCAKDASFFEELAAREVRRYVYVRTGKLLPVVESLPDHGDAIVVADGKRRLDSRRHGTLASQEYLLETVVNGDRRTVYIVGGGVGVLYGAYRFAEHLGMRFYMHGDVAPDKRVPLNLPELDERGAPLFNLRGIQPFHDFPEGPDWWNPEDYLAIVAQLPKLRMNFFGLHTYPEKRPNAEPTTWIGQPKDMNEDGTVKFAYPAIYYNTALHVSWGLHPRKTSKYRCGAGMLFDRDGYGSEIMRGLGPMPDAQEDCIEVFDRAAAMFREAFGLARQLGVKTCLGTETPLVVPQRVAHRLAVDSGAVPVGPDAVRTLYEGIFQRISRAQPLDYYWFWTPEGWTWSEVAEAQVQATIDDIMTAVAAAKAVNAPFQLATCGWVLGPQHDRALFDKVLPKDMPVSCINRSVGHEPVEPGFANVEGRPQWAIPWLEDDPAMTSPQLWVGRMRRDAYDARQYGCTGLMGIHWRTRILGPNVAALAQAAWDQGWAEQKRRQGVATPSPHPVGGKTARFDGHAFADTEDDVLYQTVRFDVDAYRLPAPDGSYTVTLRFGEPHYKEAGKRVFGVQLEGKQVIKSLDVFAKVGRDCALDYTFEEVTVNDGILDIDFTREVEYPCIAAIAVEGKDFALKVNCGGTAYEDYEADWPAVAKGWPTEDFWSDWALHQFGPEVAKDIAAIFERVDGKLPRPSDWVGGPGGYRPDGRPWAEVQNEYAFVDELAALRPRINGPGNLARFDYWLANFRFMRATGHMRCVWARYNEAVDKAKKEEDSTKRKAIAQQEALPLRKELVAVANEAVRNLLATVTTSGAMGTVANLEQHTFPGMIDGPGRELVELLGEPLPEDAQLALLYDGPPRIIVPTVRGALRPGEGLQLRVIILDAAPPERVAVHWRHMGQGDFTEAPMRHAARSTYTAVVLTNGDLEYYVAVTSAEGNVLLWPPTAPGLNQTVIVMPE